MKLLVIHNIEWKLHSLVISRSWLEALSWPRLCKWIALALTYCHARLYYCFGARIMLGEKTIVACFHMELARHLIFMSCKPDKQLLPSRSSMRHETVGFRECHMRPSSPKNQHAIVMNKPQS